MELNNIKCNVGCIVKWCIKIDDTQKISRLNTLGLNGLEVV